MRKLNDFSASMFGYLQCLGYFTFIGLIAIIPIILEKDSYGFYLLTYIFISLPAIILSVTYYLRYLYIHILLCRTYYAIGNKQRFYLLIVLILLFLFPFTAIIYAPISPFLISFLVSITDKNKVQQVLNLDSSNDFYNFKKLRHALVEQLRQST